MMKDVLLCWSLICWYCSKSLDVFHNKECLFILFVVTFHNINVSLVRAVLKSGPVGLGF